MGSRALIIAAVWLLAAAAAPAVARAAGGGDATAAARQRAQKTYDEGMAHFRRGQYRKALAKLREAGKHPEVSKRPTYHYNLAETYRRLGQLRAAHGAYRTYHTRFPTHRAAARVKRKLPRLRFGTACAVTISSRPGGATVSIDGKVRGKTPADGSPLRLRVAGGRHEVLITREGHLSVRRALVAEFGEPRAISAALVVPKGLPKVRVTANVGGARIEVDERPAGKTPATMVLSAGRHVIRVSKAGFGHSTQTIVVAKGAPDQLVSMTLSRPARFDPLDGGPFALAFAGPAFVDYGDPTLSVGASFGFGARAGYLWRLGRFGVHADLSWTLVPLTDTDVDARALFVSLLAGGGARMYFKRRFWVGLRVGVGVTLLAGASKNTFLFSGPGHTPPDDVSGIFAGFALRPELTLGWHVVRGLTLFVSPAALDYSPRFGDFAPSIKHVLRYQVSVGAGWQL